MWSDATCMVRRCTLQDSQSVCTCRRPVAAQRSHTWGSEKPHWKGHAVPLSSSTASRPAHLAQRSSSQKLRQKLLLQVLLQLADAQQLQLQLQVLTVELLRQGRLQMMTLMLKLSLKALLQMHAGLQQVAAAAMMLV